MQSQSCSIFAAATPELRRAVERAAVPLTLAGGRVLFSQGDPADSVYILDQGEIEISIVSTDGRKLTLEIMTAGEIFGEIGLFAGRRTAGATASSTCRLRSARRSALIEAISHEPALARELIDLLCERLRVVSEKLEERAFKPLPSRLAARLLHLGIRLGSSDGTIALSQSQLAEFTGATREAVAKTLAVWRGHGWISIGRGTIQLLDPRALEEVSRAE